MNQDDLAAFAALAEEALRQEELLIALTQMVLVRRQSLEDRQRILAELGRLPDCDEKQRIAEQTRRVRSFS